MKDSIKTKVIFRMTPKTKWHDSECIAFFPDIPERKNYMMSYMSIGQHGIAYMGFYKECHLATEKEYANLKEELESIGYNLLLRSRLYKK